MPNEPQHDLDCECAECVESDRVFFGAIADRLERDFRAEPDAVTTLPSHQENP